jgi:NADH-quinone oxidoreductase subunit L
VVAWVGAATALFAATIAVAQFDIKKVLAYSTISQLGFMVTAAGLGAYGAAMFHLVTHAFFKALLFLAAGSVILGVEHAHHHHADSHASGPAFDPQDMRNMGGLRRRMPVTHLVFLIGGLALAGIPPLAGFVSKDEIVADAVRLSPAISTTLLAAAVMTAFYTGRQLILVFYGKPRSDPAAHAPENRFGITGPLMALAGLTIFGGALNLPAGLPFAQRLTLWLEHTIQHLHEAEANWGVALLATLLALFGLAAAWWIYGRRPMEAGARDPLERLGPVFALLANKWWIDELYDRVILQPYVRLARFLAEKVDWAWWHDGFHDRLVGAGYRRFSAWLALSFDLPVIDGAANGLGRATQAWAGGLRRLQSGYVRTYALSVLIGAVLMLTYILLR